MNSRRLAHPTAVVSLVLLLVGCSHNGRKAPAHASSGLLDTGRASKVTHRQAADMQVAMGRSLEESGNPTEAEAAYRKAIESDPKRADAHARLAVLVGMAGKFDESSKQFARAVKLDPKNPNLLCDQGYGYYLQRRWAESESCFRKAIKLEPAHSRSHNNLGLVLARQGDADAALAEFRRAGCDTADAQANLGLILAMEGHMPEAEKAYAAALAAKPKSSEARVGLDAILAARTGARPDPVRTLAAAPGHLDAEVRPASVELPELPGQ
ncbi:tetratricopeptide repeat protein [Isosphaeraceae bacterium EP7]